MGTDQLGRDVLRRALRALTRATALAVPAWLLAVGVGGVVGMIAGAQERTLASTAVDWAIRFVFCTPFLLVLIGLGAVIGRGLEAVVLVVLMMSWAPPARLARAIAREAVGAAYVHAASAMGYSFMQLARRVLVPTCLPAILAASGGVLVEILALDLALTLFGFGASPPTPTLGTVLNDGLRFLSVAPWMMATPLALLCIVCVGLRFALQRQ